MFCWFLLVVMSSVVNKRQCDLFSVETRLQNDLLCVKSDVKLYSLDVLMYTVV